jgi:integrase
LLKIIKAPTEKRLPSVLSREEVERILGNIATFHNYAYLSTVYSCGLRLQEGLFLQVSDIDGDRKFLHIHRGKGAKDRYVPRYLGHSQLETTMVYLHLTSKGQDDSFNLINQVMKGVDYGSHR